MHSLLNVPHLDNPTALALTQQASYMLQRAPLIAIGTLDSHSRPWTTVWGGHPGFSESLGGGMIGTRTFVDGVNDPVVQSLIPGGEKGDMIQGNSKMISGLTIDLMTRKRVKIFGRMIAGSLEEVSLEYEGAEDTTNVPETQDQMQLIYKVEQSLGNCPKYLNQYEIHPALVTSKPTPPAAVLSPEARDLITKSDMFFLSSTTDEDMDTNHRGGPAGFVRIISDTEFIYPEYSGNRLYQSLGNLQMNPQIGVTFPDYSTGNILYTTGSAEILVGKDAASLLPGSNLAVKITISEARFIESGLPFRGIKKTPSPYNPLVRTLPTEGNIKASLSASRINAKLVRKTKITPTISRFTFSVPDGIAYKPGQWAAFDFSQDLDYGYSHMRNEDPLSLNDDFVRTFTISSTPTSSSSSSSATKEKDTEFAITIRQVGPVTRFLSQQNERAGFEVPVIGVGGEFVIEQEEGKITPFVAGGVGITPLLGQFETLRITTETLRLFWTVRKDDVDLVLDTLKLVPALAGSTYVFFTGTKQASNFDSKVKVLREKGVTVETRRIEKKDLDAVDAQTWYLCAGKPLRKILLGWLEGRKVVFEDFDY